MILAVSLSILFQYRQQKELLKSLKIIDKNRKIEKSQAEVFLGSQDAVLVYSEKTGILLSNPKVQLMLGEAVNDLNLPVIEIKQTGKGLQ